MTVARKVLSPGKVLREALKSRLRNVKPLLPTNWKVLYFYEYPQDKGQEDFLANVYAGKSLHEPTIVKLELLAQIILKKNSL